MIALLALVTALELAGPARVEDGSARPTTVSELLAASWAAGDEPARSFELAERALELARAEGDRSGEARALNRMGLAVYRQGDYPGAFPLYTESLRLARLEGSDDDIANALNNLGVLHYLWGSLDRALTLYEEALEIRRSQDDPGGLARTLNNLGGVADAAERYDEAVGYFEQALELYEEIGDDALAASTLNNLGQSLFSLGRMEEARTRFQSAFATAQRAGADGYLAVAEDNLGRVLLAEGRFREARTAFESGLRIKRRLGDRLGIAISLVHLASAAAELGELANAERDLRRALDTVRDLEVPQLERDIYENLADVAERAGDLSAAIDALRRYHELHARLISDAGARRLAELNAMFEVEKKNAEIARLSQARVVQRTLLGSLAGISVLLTAIVVLLWSRNRIQVRAANVIAATNAELSRAHDELERASRAEIAHLARVTSLGEMTAAVAHELNQPLAAILTNAQLAEAMVPGGDPEAEELQATIADITLGARRAWELLHNLRYLARRGEVERGPVDLREVLGVAVDVAGAEARLHEVTVHLEVPPEPLPVDGDQVLLQQVILNLLQNAITAMADSPVRPRRVSVSAEVESDLVRVEVEDAGAPVDDEVLANLFRPFFTTREGGLGMGLAISKRLVEAHDGRIWARRAGELGLVVAFDLPLIAEALDGADGSGADDGGAPRA